MPDLDIKDRFGLVPEAEFAKLRNVKVTALRNERARGSGPPHIKLGNKVFYPLDKLKKFLAAATVTPKRTPTLIDGKSQRSRRA